MFQSFRVARSQVACEHSILALLLETLNPETLHLKHFTFYTDSFPPNNFMLAPGKRTRGG